MIKNDLPIKHLSAGPKSLPALRLLKIPAFELRDMN
jgi:hypothetical protein